MQAGPGSASREDTAGLYGRYTLNVVFTARKAVSHHSCDQAVEKASVEF